MRNSINTNTCTKCRICSMVCPAKLIEMNNSGTMQFKAEKEHLCMMCGQCMAVCVSKSVMVKGLSYEDNMIPLTGDPVEYKTFYHFLTGRRSVRNFQDKPVPKELLQKIVDCVAMAPYGAGTDNISITYISDRDVLKKSLPLMSAFYRKMEKWLKNPFMRFMIKKNAGEEGFNTIMEHLLPRIKIGHYEIDKGNDHILRNAPVLMLLHAKKGTPEMTDDGLIYTTYAALAAHALGLGATINGLVPAAVNKIPELKKMFHVPEDHVVIKSLILGFSRVRYRSGIIHEKQKVKYVG